MPVIEKEPESENPFLGVYVADFPSSVNGIISYSVEFKSDKTARVLLFKKASQEPQVSYGKWLIAKDSTIILYFMQNIPPEFFKRNEDGSLSFLNSQRKPYSGELAKILVLQKIKKN